MSRYYVLAANIYQAPTLQACLRARTRRCAFHLGAAFTRLQADLEPLEWRERQRTKRLKRTGAVASATSAEKPDIDHVLAQADASLTQAATAASATAEGGQAVERGAAAQTNARKDKHLQDVDVVDALEREAAAATVQAPPAPQDHYLWVRRTDDVIINVLSRCA